VLQPGSLLSRSLALVLMLGATLALYEFALLPLIAAHSRARTTIEQTKALLQRYHALAEERAWLADQVSASDRIIADSDSYLTGPNDILAAAALQERSESVIERARGELRSIHVLPAQAVKTAVPVRLIALKIQFIIDSNGLRDVLYELETGNPYLFILELRIQRHDRPNTEPRLDVSLTVEGYTNGSNRANASPTSRSYTPPVPQILNS
jgi:general secretion pathway protein M